MARKKTRSMGEARTLAPKVFIKLSGDTFPERRKSTWCSKKKWKDSEASRITACNRRRRSKKAEHLILPILLHFLILVTNLVL